MTGEPFPGLSKPARHCRCARTRKNTSTGKTRQNNRRKRWPPPTNPRAQSGENVRSPSPPGVALPLAPTPIPPSQHRLRPKKGSSAPALISLGPLLPKTTPAPPRRKSPPQCLRPGKDPRCGLMSSSGTLGHSRCSTGCCSSSLPKSCARSNVNRKMPRCENAQKRHARHPPPRCEGRKCTWSRPPHPLLPRTRPRPRRCLGDGRKASTSNLCEGCGSMARTGASSASWSALELLCKSGRTHKSTFSNRRRTRLQRLLPRLPQRQPRSSHCRPTYFQHRAVQVTQTTMHALPTAATTPGANGEVERDPNCCRLRSERSILASASLPRRPTCSTFLTSALEVALCMPASKLLAYHDVSFQHVARLTEQLAMCVNPGRRVAAPDIAAAASMPPLT